MEAKRLRLLILIFMMSFSMLVLVSVHFAINFPDEFPVETVMIGDWIEDMVTKLTLPIKLARISAQDVDENVLIPVHGTRLAQITDSWNAPRPDGRVHEGTDIFARRGTPIFSATEGYIIRLGFGETGGYFVTILGSGGRRYYYAHLDRFADGLEIGNFVTTDTAIGFVGNSGNASSTPTHLHFGVYEYFDAIDPLPLLINRQ